MGQFRDSPVPVTDLKGFNFVNYNGKVEKY
jgi:hypothetical protein